MENLKHIGINKKKNIKKYLVIFFSLLLSLLLFTCGEVKDTKPPEVISVVLPDNQLHNRAIVINFSEPIENIIQSRFKLYTGDSESEQTTSQIILSFSISNNNQVYLILQNEVANGHYIKTVIDDQAVSDRSGNPVRRTVLNPLRNYIDNQPPQVTSASLPAQQQNNRIVIINFNEPIKDAVQSRFEVYTGDSVGTQTTSQTISSLSVSNDEGNKKYQVYLNLQNEIANGHYIKVIVNDQAVLDEAGNPVSRTVLDPLRNYVDNEGPLVNGVKATVTSAVNNQIIVTFDEEVQSVDANKFKVYTGTDTGNINTPNPVTVAQKNLGNSHQVILTVQNNLTLGEYVRVEIVSGAVQDNLGNNAPDQSPTTNPPIRVSSTQVDQEASSGDNQGPLVNGITATVTSTVNNQIIVTFDEEVQSPDASKFKVYTGTDTGNINNPNPVTVAQKSPTNSHQVILTVENNLNLGEYVRVEIVGGAVQDNLRNDAPIQSPTTNPPIGVTSTQIKQGGSIDNIRPTIVDWTITADTSEILFAFSEAVKDIDTSKVHITQGTSGNVNQNNNVLSAQILTYNNHMIKVTFANTFPGGNYVKYSIDEGFVKDLNNNLIQTTVSAGDKQVISSVVYITNFFTNGIHSVSSPGKNSIETGDSEFLVNFTKAVQSYNKVGIAFEEIRSDTNKQQIISHISLLDNGFTIKVSLKDYQFPGFSDLVKGATLHFVEGSLTFTTNEKNYYQSISRQK